MPYNSHFFNKWLNSFLSINDDDNDDDGKLSLPTVFTRATGEKISDSLNFLKILIKRSLAFLAR